MYSISNNGYLFKETYDDISKNHYNGDTPLLARSQKRYDLQGTKAHVAVPMGMAGGVGGLVNGYLPEAGSESGEQIEITAKDVVAQARVDRKAMKAAMKDRGAFVRFTQRPVQKAVESYDQMVNILLYGDATGRLTKTKSSGAYISGGATAPVIEMDSTEFFERWLPKNFQVEFGNAGDTGVEDGVFKITSVAVSTLRVTFTRQSGSFDASAGVNGRWVYLQNMFQAAPQGLKGTVQNASASMYGVAYDATSWGSYRFNADGAPPSISMLNRVFNQQLTRVDQECLPNFLLTSPEIWAQFADLREGDKEITLKPRDSAAAEAGFGFAGIKYTTPAGKTIPIVADKHCPKQSIFGLYDEVMYMYHLPDHGWWDEDGQVFLRVPNRPWYEATYGGYFEYVVHPTFQIEIYGVGIPT